MPVDFPASDPPARFPATRRSAVLGAGSEDPVLRARSFDRLARAYWKPVYAHVRRRWRRSPEDAGDLTQGFFGRAFEKRYFAAYDPAKALFRTYLKTCLDRFVMEEARGTHRQKRGGGTLRLSLDFDVAERELADLGAAQPDAAFDAAWTRSLFAAALERLEAKCARDGKDAYYTVFRRYVLHDAAASERPSYAQLARELSLTVADVNNYLAWARREFKRLLLAELRAITATDEEYRSEARALLGIDP